ncbi:MAG: S8 family serine peptidase [Candidatus Paceibacterota bacterium]|jgi:hypothetical protein
MDNIGRKTEGSVEKEGKMNIPEFVDLTVWDTEELQRQISESSDISYIPKEVLESAIFDTTFEWPAKLPRGFDPEKLMEESKNPGLGIRKIHEEGITGKGVIVGIIDQRISPAHSEFRANIISNKEYYESKTLEEDTEISMHGPAVVSLLAGRTCGVAPDAKVVYGAENSAVDGFLGFTRALKDIIEYNKKNEPRIKIVSVSKGYDEVPGVKEWLELKEEAKRLGIIVIDSDYFNENNLTGGGSKKDKDRFDDYELPLFYKESEMQTPSVEDTTHKLSLVSEDIRKKFFDKYKSIENFLNNRKEELSNDLIIPSDYRTMASGKGDSEYRYEAKGGWSWAIPYFSGVFALALQVNPNLTNEKFLEIVRKTAGKNKKGIKVISPSGIIEEVKKM